MKQEEKDFLIAGTVVGIILSVVANVLTMIVDKFFVTSLVFDIIAGIGVLIVIIAGYIIGKMDFDEK